MATPEPASQVTHFHTCVDDLINVLKLPAVWAGHPPAPVVSKLLETLLAMLRQNFADGEQVQSRINDLVTLLADQQVLTRVEDEQRKRTEDELRKTQAELAHVS